MKDKDYEQLATKIMMNALEGLKIQISKAYNRGLAEAWEAAKKIHDGQISYEVFGLDKTGNGLSYASPLNWGETITAQEVIAKIKEYEDKQKQDAEIKVGDEVVLNANATYENEKSIILAYDETIYPYNVLMSNGDTEWIKKDVIERKTGRHFPQIAEVLAELRGAENDE